VLSAAQFTLKQAAVPVTISGLEKLQNSGKEEMIDLMKARLDVAELHAGEHHHSGLLRRRNGLERQVPRRPRRRGGSDRNGLADQHLRRNQPDQLLLLEKLLHFGDGDHQHGRDGAGGRERRMGGRGARVGSAGPRDHGHELLEGLDGQPPGDPAVQRSGQGEARICHYTQYMNMDIYLDGGIGGFAGDAVDARNLLLAEQQVPEVPSAQGPQLRRALARSVDTQ
jgi:hypothetical protein